MQLQDKVAVVVGGTSGIGKAIATRFLEEGAKVIATSSNLEKVKATAEEIRKYHEPLIEAIEVRSSSQLAAFFKKVQQTFGRIDVVVNCAGTHLKKPTVDVTDDEWEKVIDINLNGLFFSCREAGRIMLQQKFGAIINIASLGSYVALRDAAAYSASKAGVLSLTKNLAVEWADFGVRVNALVPGVFQTELNKKALADEERRKTILSRTPMKRFGDVRELASIAVYLASDAASFTTGAAFNIDGGFLATGI
jgi:NAD(P)-dependent dehydrogenase (short-subunit alcohol dehydrogenase family)